MAEQKSVKVKVLKGFICKETGNEYKRRDVVEVSQSRYEELKGTYVEKSLKSDTLTKKESKGCKNC